MLSWYKMYKGNRKSFASNNEHTEDANGMKGQYISPL